MKSIIYHNERCSKSRQALHILEDEKIPHTVRYYLEDPLSKAEIKALHKKLDVPLSEMVRPQGEFFKDLFGADQPTDDQLLQALVQYPVLLQRPIVETAEKAVIARPPEKLHEIL